MYKIIKEQFNINDLDFSDDVGYMNNSIFSKDFIHPYYDKILNNTITADEIKKLNGGVAVTKAKNYEELKKIADYYSKNFPNDSLNWLDVSEITDMSYIFSGDNFENIYNAYNGDISKWNVSNVLNMEGMFMSSKFNGDISEWDVSNVENMKYMFDNSLFNSDISHWDVSNVSEMDSMFYKSKFNKDISKWNISNACWMSSMFAYSDFNQDISQWQLQDGDYDAMFDKCKIKRKYMPKLLKLEYEAWKNR